MGGQGGQLPSPPPSLVRNINYSGNFYLGVGQSSCSCFVSLIFLIFSFHLSLAPYIKTHTKRQEMALKRLYFSKFSWGACPRTPLEVLTPSAQIRVHPPKISKPVHLCVAVSKLYGIACFCHQTQHKHKLYEHSIHFNDCLALELTLTEIYDVI